MKHVFLMFNMGNSGGEWFKKICNVHEDVCIWQELNHIIGVQDLDNQIQLDRVYEFFMEKCRNDSHKTIGLIKAFDDRMIKFCEDNGGVIVQMFRHPIGVVNFKNGHKMTECRHFGHSVLDTPENIFEAHVDYYASRYRTYTLMSERWPLIKLETLKDTIKNDVEGFENLMCDILKVVWNNEHTKKVLQMGGLEQDLSHFDIWKSWESWKREIFLEYFEDIMKIHNYKWEP